jgi:hypothetical protein
MADDLFIPDQPAGGTATASRDELFIPDKPSYDDSDSPETDKALAETSMWEKAIGLASKISPVGVLNQYNKAVMGSGLAEKAVAAAKMPSPPWMQPIEKAVRDVATYQIPGVAQANPLYWAGRYNQEVAKYLPRPFSTGAETAGALGVGLSKGVASMATPMNIGLAVLPGASEGVAGKALAGMFTGQALLNTPEQVEQIKQDYAKGNVAGTIQHSAELAGSYLPGLHFFGGKGGPPKGPVKTATKELTPQEFIEKYGEAPEDLTEGASREVPGAPPTVKSETAKVAAGGLSEDEAKIISGLQGKLQKGEITQDEYRKEAKKALKVGEEPLVSDGTYDYKYDPEDNVYKAINDDGEAFRVINPGEFPEGTPERANSEALVDRLAAERERVATERETAAEPPAVGETDVQAEKRARREMRALEDIAGDPKAVLQDLIDVKGSEPTWGEYADAIREDINRLAPTQEIYTKLTDEGTARRRGISLKQLERETELRRQHNAELAMKEGRDTQLSRQELAEEAKAGKKGGGKYAVKGGYEKVPAREITLGVETGGGGPLTRPGRGDNVERETEGGPGGREVSPRLEKRDKELENRAIHNVEIANQLPKNKAELVRLQEDDPERWPSDEEIAKMVDLEYMKLSRDKRAKQKASEAGEKKETPAGGVSIPVMITKRMEAELRDKGFTQEEINKMTPQQAHEANAAEKKATPAKEEPPPVRGTTRKPGEAPLRPEVFPGKSGAGEREIKLNADALGLTKEEYLKWREGAGPDFPSDADSIAARQKARGIKPEQPPEEPPAGGATAPVKPVTPPGSAPSGKSFKVRTALDDYANSPETPVATAVNEMGGIKSKTAARAQGKYEGNEALWDDAPKLSHITHRKIYKPSGEMPDVAAQTLYDAGLIKEASVREMNLALEQESAGIRNRIKATPEKGNEGKIRQAEKFGQGQRSEVEAGSKAVPAKELAVGDKVKVDKTELKVTKIDSNGDVTLEDGKRYGVQEVAGDEVIYGEVEAPAKAETPAAVSEEKFSTKKNFKRVGEGRYEHKNSKVIISKGKEGGWDIRHPATGEVFDTQATREKAMRAYADGQTVSVRDQATKLKLRADKEGGYTTLIPDALDFGKRIYQKGMSYARWSRDMVKHLGKAIKDHLKNIWEELTGGKFRPGFKEGGGMRSGPLRGGTGGRRHGYGRDEPTPQPVEQPLEQQQPVKPEKIRHGYGRPEGRADTVKDTVHAANQRLQRNPRRADQLVTELSSGKRTSLDPVDETILVQHKAVLQGIRDKAGKDAMNLKLTRAEREEAAATFQNQENQLATLEYATQDGSLFTGKSQSKMWHTFKAKDYEMDAMKEKLYVAKGGVDVTPEETKKLQTNVDRLSAMMAQEAGRKITTGWKPGAKRDPVLRDIQFASFEAKKALDDTIFKAQFKTKSNAEKGFHYAWNVMAIPRAIMASTDLSAIRRQGGLLFMSHPIRALNAMPDMVRAMKSERAYFDLMQDIRERPNAPLYVSSKLGLTDVSSPRLSQLEEQYMSPWAEKIPIVNHSQRAYVYFLNRLRADTFDAMSMLLTRSGMPNAKQAAAISNFINVFTGRGTIPGNYASSIALLNNMFFAPRYVLSRFQALTGQPLRYALKADPAVTKLIAGEYARTLLGYGVVYGIVGTALKDYASVEWDPRSTDFGKIKVGNTRVDIMSGLSQTTVFLARSAPEVFGLGKTKTAQGKVLSLGGGRHAPITQEKYGQTAWKFVRGKFAPLPAAFFNAKEGETVVGQPTTTLNEIGKMVTPMSSNDVLSALYKYGLSKESALSLLTIFGDSVQTYSPKATTGRSRKHHRTRSF